MARFSVSQKSQRVLKFTMGLRSNQAYTALAKHGFGESDLREGLELLAAVVRKRLDTPLPRQNRKSFSQLDQFENYWFPIVRATLARHFPEVSEQFMRNLSSTAGINVTITVATFVERLTQLEAGASPYGPKGIEARALLAERGLTAEVVDQAMALLSEVAVFTEEALADTASNTREAEDAMWQWYLEWSAIARQAIKNRNVLRRLGFLQRNRGEASQPQVMQVIEVRSRTIPAESSAGVIASPQLAAENKQAEQPAETEVAISA